MSDDGTNGDGLCGRVCSATRVVCDKPVGHTGAHRGANPLIRGPWFWMGVSCGVANGRLACDLEPKHFGSHRASIAGLDQPVYWGNTAPTEPEFRPTPVPSTRGRKKKE